MATEDERKLFVAGLPDSVTDELLRLEFERTGSSVVDVSLPRDRATGRPRGFGFVTLATAAEAHSARVALDGALLGGRPISVRPFQGDGRSQEPRGPRPAPERAPFERRDRTPPAPAVAPLQAPPRAQERPREPFVPRRAEFDGERPRGPVAGPAGGGAPGPSRDQGDRTLYVGNLPYDASPQELEAVLLVAEVGPVQRVHIPVGPDGRVRFGFITFATPAAAQAAVERLRDAELRGRRLSINVAHARGERPERTDRVEPRFPRPEPQDARPIQAEAAGEPAPVVEDGEGGEARGEKKKKKRGAGVTAPKDRDNKRASKRWQDWDDDG